MAKEYRISLSAGEIGKPFLKDFCPRCFWFTKKFPLENNHPFSSPMAGILSIADSYIKSVVKWHMENLNMLPSWILTQLKTTYPDLDFESIRQVKPKRWEVPLFHNSLVLKGQADEILEFPDGSWFIIDYKLASFSENQKNLLPLYEAQLNAYAYLANKTLNKQIAGLALVYLNPEYKDLEDEIIFHRTKDEFFFGFKPKVVPVKLMDTEWIEDLCRNIFEILSLDKPPEGKANCQGCNILVNWLNKISNCLL